MNDMLNALEDFCSSGYKIDVKISGEDLLPISVQVENDGRLSLSNQDRVIPN